jgi:hypothetical protein
MEDRLVDIAEADSEGCEGVQDLIGHPTRMANLDYQRIVLKPRLQLPKVFPILRLVLEGPRKLNQYRPESVCLRNAVNACFEIALLLRRRLPLMRKRVEKLGREAEILLLLTLATHFRAVPGCGGP